MPVNPGKGGGGGGGGGASRFYLSTAPAPAAGIYTDFNILMAAFALVPSSEVREIFVLDSLTLDEKTVPGGWDFTNATWMSSGLPGSVVVTTPPGFSCTVPPRLFKDIAVIHNGTDPFWTMSAPGTEWIRFDNGQIESASGARLFNLQAPNSLVSLWLDNDSQILKGSGPVGTRIFVGISVTVLCRTTIGSFSTDILETDASLPISARWTQQNFSRDAAVNVTYAGQVGFAAGSLTVNNLAAEWRLGPVVALAAGVGAVNVDISWGEIVPITVGAGAGLTGMTGGVDGRRVTLLNTSNEPLVLFNDIASIPANRIYTQGRIPFQSLPAYGSVTLIYDGALSRWVIQGRDQGTERHSISTTLDATSVTQHSTFYLAAGVTLPNLTSGSAGTEIRVVSTDLVNPISIVLPDNGIPSAGWTIAISPGGGGTFMWGGAIWQCIGNT